MVVDFDCVGRWKEPGYYQHMCTSGRGNLARRYANLWHTMIKRRQNDTNATFYVYLENITHLVAHTSCISTETVETYKDITHFKVGMHHMYVQAKKDPTRQWFPTSYRLTIEDVCLIVNDWEDGWKIPAEKIGNQKRKERKIRVMKNQMRSREMIKTMVQEIFLAHPQQKSNRQSPQ
jgi:hypothetical protein